ncbi:hypothetical protein EV426DRAFT_678199 [Tirmania nivea]|nr:hypothetical protein EV426DRAFT_678199 [Tirmania nivea]
MVFPDGTGGKNGEVAAAAITPQHRTGHLPRKPGHGGGWRGNRTGDGPQVELGQTPNPVGLDGKQTGTWNLAKGGPPRSRIEIDLKDALQARSPKSQERQSHRFEATSKSPEIRRQTFESAVGWIAGSRQTATAAGIRAAARARRKDQRSEPGASPQVKPDGIIQPPGRSLPRVYVHDQIPPRIEYTPPTKKNTRKEITSEPPPLASHITLGLHPLTTPASFSHHCGSSHTCSQLRPFPSATPGHLSENEPEVADPAPGPSPVRLQRVNMAGVLQTPSRPSQKRKLSSPVPPASEESDVMRRRMGIWRWCTRLPQVLPPKHQLRRIPSKSA